MKLRYSGAFQEDREQLPGREGGKQPKLGMDGYAGGSPLNCPLMPAPDSPQPLAVPAGLSLCGRHVWSWLAGVLAWRSHLSIIDFPPCLFCPVCHSVFPLLLFSFLSLFYSFQCFCSLCLSPSVIVLISLPLSPFNLLSSSVITFLCSSNYFSLLFILALIPISTLFCFHPPPPPPPHAIPL